MKMFFGQYWITAEPKTMHQDSPPGVLSKFYLYVQVESSPCNITFNAQKFKNDLKGNLILIGNFLDSQTLQMRSKLQRNAL